MEKGFRYLGFSLIGFLFVTAAYAATYTVTSQQDSGLGSLRQCVLDANANPGADTIVFSLANSITVYTGIMITDTMTIDGNGTQVLGQSTSSYILFLADGSSGSIIRNLALVNGGDAIMVNSNNNQILNCRIGTDWANSTGRGNVTGVYIFGTITGNVVGALNQGNVISGNSNYGIHMEQGARLTTIQSNIIGLTSDGSTVLPNVNGGIYVVDSHTNYIGGNRSASVGNLISGNGSFGVRIEGFGNTLCGNIIGLAQDGQTIRGNGNGVDLEGSGNFIGGSIVNASNMYGNVISGNSAYGVFLKGAGNTLAGNYIGLNATGTLARANQYGIIVSGASAYGNGIGMGSVGMRNVISGNSYDGVHMEACGGQMIRGNYIGTSADGLSVISNGNHSIYMDAAQQSWVGGESENRNLFCGSGNYSAVYGYSSSTWGNTFTGNWVNVLANGTLATPALEYGFYFHTFAAGNSIGLKNTGVGNLIAGTRVGIALFDTLTDRVGFYGNTICSFANPATGIAIQLTNDGANDNKPSPTILVAGALSISGTSAAGDYIQVFRSDRGAGFEGGSLQRVGTAVADGSGNWSLTPTGLIFGDYVCALASDASDNTSKFSTNVAVTGISSPTATPTATQTGTTTSTPTVTATVTPTLTASATFTHSSTQTPTATITPTLTASATYTQSPTHTSTATVTPTLTASPEASSVELMGKKLLAYPNPGKEKITIAFLPIGSGEAKIQIYNMSGERVATLSAQVSGDDVNSVIWNCSSIAPGLYVVRVVQDGKEIGKSKVAVVR